MSLGFDVGTYNLVCCSRDEKGNFIHKREINAFLEMPIEPRYVFDMMKKNGVPLIERENTAYALGEAAVNIAYTMNQDLKRPMKDGCVNPKEKDSYQIMSIMIHGLLDDVKADKETLFYCVPANAINEETDAVYHQKILEAIFRDFESDDGKKVSAHPINEALALVYAELGAKAFTGIAASFGSGLINVCHAVLGHPAFMFAIANSGDWIDYQAAKATGESPIFINQEKTKIDLTKPATSIIERAIQTQYRIMIEKTVIGLKKGFTDIKSKSRSDKPIDIVIAGGTSIPNGFDKLFKETLDTVKLPINIGEIKRPADPLFAVARGCLMAAEASTKG